MPNVILLFLLLLFSQAAFAQRAQQPAEYRILGGLSFGTPLTFDRASPSLRHFGTSGTGTSRDQAYTLAFETCFDLTDRQAFLLRFGYTRGNGSFISSDFTRGDTLQRFGITTEYSAIELSTLLQHRFTPWLRGISGLTLSYFPTRSAVHAHDVISVGSQSVNSSIELARDGALLSPLFHVSIPLTARLTLLKTGSLEYALDLSTSLNATEAIRGYFSRSFRVGGGIAIGLVADDNAPVEPAPQPATPVTMLPQFRTTARFEVNGVDADSVEVIATDTITTITRAVPQYYYFAVNEVDPTDQQIEMLHVIAERLKTDPTAAPVIREFGHTSETKLTRNRRKMNVIGALSSNEVHSWTSFEGGKTDRHPYVLLANAKPEIFLPVQTEEVSRGLRVERLSINRFTVADLGVKGWTITVMNGADTLVEYDNTDYSDEQDGFGFSLPVDAKMITLHAVVLSSTGLTAEARDTLHVRHTNARRDHRISEFYLTGDPKPKGQTWSFDEALIKKLGEIVTSESELWLFVAGENSLDLVDDVVEPVVKAGRDRGQDVKKIYFTPTPETMMDSPGGIEVRVVGH